MMRRKLLQKKNQKKKKNLIRRNQAKLPHLTQRATTVIRMGKVKAEIVLVNKKKKRMMVTRKMNSHKTHLLHNQTLLLLVLNQYLNYLFSYL